MVFVGRLAKPKNPLFMIDILACLKERSVSLLMVGGGELDTPLRAYAKSKEVEHLVTFAGPLPHCEALKAFCSARVAVMPSLWDGLPILPMEAGYLGLPVVAAAIPGVDEIIEDGKNGFLIPTYDPKLYAAAINRLLDDPSLALKMGAQGKQRVDRRFLRRHNTQAFIDIYHSASCFA